MNNIIKRKWNQNSMVIIEDLQGMAFQAESGGHTFQISGIDGEGNTVALSGTPAGVMLRSDGQDVALTCSASGGVVSATLPANAYSVPGRFGLTIFLTSDGQKTAIYAAVGTVSKTSSGTVAPPAGSDVVDLVNRISAAIAAIPASYNSCFAPAYSTSGLYSVGQYVTYDGKLYRCNTPITTAETWTAAHWTQTNLGADVYDLKSALSTCLDFVNGVVGFSSNKYVVNLGSANTLITSVPVIFPYDVKIQATNGDKCLVWNCINGAISLISANGSSITTAVQYAYAFTPVLISFRKSNAGNLDPTYMDTHPNALSITNASTDKAITNFVRVQDSLNIGLEKSNFDSRIHVTDLSAFDNKAYVSGAWVTQAKRITNVNPIVFPFGVSVKPENNYKLIVFVDGTGGMSLVSDWTTSAVQLDANKKYYLTIMRTEDNNIDPAIADSTIQIIYNTHDLKAVDAVSFIIREKYWMRFEETEQIAKNVDNELYNETVALSASDFSGKAYLWVSDSFSSRTDICTNNTPFHFDRDVIVSPKTGYKIIGFYCDSLGSNIQLIAGEWRTFPLVIPANKYFLIEIRKNANNTNISTTEAANNLVITIPSMTDDVDGLYADENHEQISKADEIVLQDNTIADSSEFFILDSGDTVGRVKKIINPYQKQYKNQYMGQLHDHSWTMEHPEDEHDKTHAENVYTTYKRMGYDFMTITNYPYFEDVTPCPYNDDSAVLWICNSVEVGVVPESLDSTHQATHLVVLNTTNSHHNIQGPNVRVPDVGDVIDDLLDEGSCVTLAHPMWIGAGISPTSDWGQTLYSAEQLLALTERLKYVEIFNTLSISHEETPYVSNSAYALDVLASAGRIVWGVAVSDSHDVSNQPLAARFEGNIKVFAKERTKSAIWESYLDGNYYCCEKVCQRLNSIKYENNVFSIDIGDPGATTKFYSDNATVVKTVSSSSVASYTLTGKEKYVRAEITMVDGSRIWTNPIYVLSDSGTVVH